MIVLVSGSTKTMRRLGAAENLGVFFNPNSSNYRTQAVPAGVPWAADNAAFKDFNAERYTRMLDTLHRRALPGCMFVTVPDVVADAAATLRQFWRWRPIVARYGWPLAFVAQDGLTVRSAPWRYFEVLFIGGSTWFKLGAQAATLSAYAKALGKRVHVGRVNSRKRLELFSDVADSIDGTKTSRHGDIFIPVMLAASQRQPTPRRIQRELTL